MIKLSQRQLMNLQVFLDRVDLKGNEVPAYVDIINSINIAEKDEKTEDIENA